MYKYAIKDGKVDKNEKKACSEDEKGSNDNNEEYADEHDVSEYESFLKDRTNIFI